MLIPLSLFLIAVITRVPFMSSLLYHMDSVQFALALQKYDLTVHQPHPPGYFLYIMLGRILNIFMHNANDIFVVISIVFSGLAVVAIFLLGKEMFDELTGLFAALLAITSPNLWFHGEVALSYAVEAFFSAAVAYACWKTYRGDYRYAWISAVMLGIAGGIRQSSLVFLVPLWLLSVSKASWRQVLGGLAILASVCLLWLVPMVAMTGGWEAYRAAFHELWLFNTGHVSVFEKGMATFRIFSRSLFRFVLYGVGVGAAFLVMACYSIIRFRRFRELNRAKTAFFFFWIAPSFLFYLLIFIHPANPGYILVFLPALLLLAAKSAIYISADLVPSARSRFIAVIMVSVISMANAGIFLFSGIPASRREIRDHDSNLALMLRSIRQFDPQRAAVFVNPYVFFGYRQIMYYLPQYYTYQMDSTIAANGEMRKTFWGKDRRTFLTQTVELPEGIDQCIVPLISDDSAIAKGIEGLEIKRVVPTLAIVTGRISKVKELFPRLDIKGSSLL